MNILINETYLMECVKQASYYDYCKDSRRALEALSEVWSDFNSEPDVAGLSDELSCEILIVCGSVLSNYGLYAQEINYHEKAQDLLTRARDLAVSINNRDLIAEADKQTAVSYWREGRYENALIYSDVVFNNFSESEIPTNEICLLTKCNLIVINLRLGEYTKALNLIKETQFFIDNCQNLRVKTSFYTQAGNFFIFTGKYEKATEYLLKTLDYATESKNLTYLGNSLNNLGIVYAKLQQFDKAHEFIQRALDLYESENSSANYALALESLASVYFKENELSKASVTIDESISILKRGENYPQLCESLWTRVIILIRTVEKREAILQFNEILNITQEHLSLAITEKYIDQFNDLLYLPTGGDFYEQAEYFRLHLLDKALIESGGAVKPTAAALGISHQNTSALLKKYPALCKKHGVVLRVRKPNKIESTKKRLKTNDNNFVMELSSDRLAHLGLVKGMRVSISVMPLENLDLASPVMIQDAGGDYHCGFLIYDFGMFAFGNGSGEINQTYFPDNIIKSGQVTGFYDVTSGKYRPLSDLEI